MKIEGEDVEWDNSARMRKWESRENEEIEKVKEEQIMEGYGRD